jgi:hypothetical protein
MTRLIDAYETFMTRHGGWLEVMWGITTVISVIGMVVFGLYWMIGRWL